jgi:hypothetical protein
VHPFCNLQSRARTHAVLVISMYGSLVLCVCFVDLVCPLIFCPFSSGRCIVGPSVYSFWLSSSYLQNSWIYVWNKGPGGSSLKIWFWFLVFNATFSNISAISWRPVLVVEEAGVPGENHRPCREEFCHRTRNYLQNVVLYWENRVNWYKV